MNTDTLIPILSKILNTTITCADHRTTPLHGGTLGDVRLLEGVAETVDGAELPYKLVVKRQKQWERFGDPLSWRREYDLYQADLDTYFPDHLRRPTCYHAELNAAGDEITLWMEYINGVSGLALTGDMYERAAELLGRLQGRLYAEKPPILSQLSNLSGLDYMKRFYMHYRSWPIVYDYISSAECAIPEHLCRMLIDLDERSEDILSRVESLPVVLCHRDFWVANIFGDGGDVVLIDWDTTGWGYLGEDIASLIADEADVEHMVEYYKRCVPAYYRGFSEYADVSAIERHCIREMMLLMFGYRLIEWYLNADTPEGKALQVDTLQRIYEMGLDEG